MLAYLQPLSITSTPPHSPSSPSPSSSAAFPPSSRTSPASALHSKSIFAISPTSSDKIRQTSNLTRSDFPNASCTLPHDPQYFAAPRHSIFPSLGLTSLFNAVHTRALGMPIQLASYIPKVSILRTAQCSARDTYSFHSSIQEDSNLPLTVKFPPLCAAQFNSTKDPFAVCDEGGYATLMNAYATSNKQETPDCPYDAFSNQIDHSVFTEQRTSSACLSRWKCHNNTILDFTWSQSADLLITASGDQTCRIWDCSTQQQIQEFQGHTGSVKSVDCPIKEDSFLFASGGRDGKTFVWDRRTLAIAHSISSRTTSAASPPRSSSKRTINNSILNPSLTVTSVKFLSEKNILAISHDSESSIHLFDLRYITSQSSNRALRPLHSLHPPVAHTYGQKLFGISSIIFDPVYNRVLASATNHKLYLYELSGSSLPDLPSQVYEGPQMNFYTKTSFSPCGEFIASASKDSNVYLYESDPKIRPSGDNWKSESITHKPFHTLSCHQEETSSVDWSKQQFGTLATTSDDERICIWRPTNNSKQDADDSILCTDMIVD